MAHSLCLASCWPTQVIPGAKALGYKVQAYAFEGYWEDIGTIEAFYRANLALVDPHKPNFRYRAYMGAASAATWGKGGICTCLACCDRCSTS